MDDVTATDWAEAPWWLDAVAETDTVGCPEQWAELAELGPLSVEETLLAIAAAGPGPEAARLLVSLRGQPLTDEQKLTVVGLWQPQLAWTTAAEQAALLDLVGPEPDPHDKQASGAVRRVRPAGAGRRPAQHGAARGRADPAGPADGFHFTATQQLLAEGRIDGYRVWLMLQTLTTLPPELARQVEADILPRAAGLTGAELRTAVRDAARKVDPDWGVRMFAKTRKTRRVGFDHRGTDGLVLLYAYLPPVEAVAIQEHLHRAAAVPSPHPGDERSVDERMADALIGCVLGSTPGDVTTPLAPQVITRLLISLPTLLGLRQDTGELAGYGKIPAGMARQLATDSEFQRMIYHPVDGHLLDYHTRTYRPPKDLDTYTRARDRHCRFPGCTQPAEDCDLDHTKPFRHHEHERDSEQNDVPEQKAVPGQKAVPDRVDDQVHNDVPEQADDQGGSTSAGNLASLCRYTHRAKTHGHYHTRQDPDGTLHCTTPLGRTYTTKPWDYRPDSER